MTVHKTSPSVRRESERDIEKTLEEFQEDVPGFSTLCVLLIKLGSILVDYKNIEVKKLSLNFGWQTEC